MGGGLPLLGMRGEGERDRFLPALTCISIAFGGSCLAAALVSQGMAKAAATARHLKVFPVGRSLDHVRSV